MLLFVGLFAVYALFVVCCVLFVCCVFDGAKCTVACCSLRLSMIGVVC